MGGSSIDYDAVLDLCRARHRRIALAVFAADRRSLSVADLAKAVVKHNHGTPITEVSEELLEHVLLDLHHVHVPRLVAAGVAEYDPERKLVEPTERFEELEPHLSAILEADPELEPPVAL